MNPALDGAPDFYVEAWLAVMNNIAALAEGGVSQVRIDALKGDVQRSLEAAYTYGAIRALNG